MYIPFEALIEVVLMRRYHNKLNLGAKGVRLGLDMKLARMGHTKRISHTSR